MMVFYNIDDYHSEVLYQINEEFTRMTTTLVVEQKT